MYISSRRPSNKNFHRDSASFFHGTLGGKPHVEDGDSKQNNSGSLNSHAQKRILPCHRQSQRYVINFNCVQLKCGCCSLPD